MPVYSKQIRNRPLPTSREATPVNEAFTTSFIIGESKRTNRPKLVRNYARGVDSGLIRGAGSSTGLFDTGASRAPEGGILKHLNDKKERIASRIGWKDSTPQRMLRERNVTRSPAVSVASMATAGSCVRLVDENDRSTGGFVPPIATTPSMLDRVKDWLWGTESIVDSAHHVSEDGADDEMEDEFALPGMEVSHLGISPALKKTPRTAEPRSTREFLPAHRGTKTLAGRKQVEVSAAGQSFCDVAPGDYEDEFLPDDPIPAPAMRMGQSTTVAPERASSPFNVLNPRTNSTDISKYQMIMLAEMKSFQARIAIAREIDFFAVHGPTASMPGSFLDDDAVLTLDAINASVAAPALNSNITTYLNRVFSVLSPVKRKVKAITNYIRCENRYKKLPVPRCTVVEVSQNNQEAKPKNTGEAIPKLRPALKRPRDANDDSAASGQIFSDDQLTVMLNRTLVDRAKLRHPKRFKSKHVDPLVTNVHWFDHRYSDLPTKEEHETLHRKDMLHQNRWSGQYIKEFVLKKSVDEKDEAKPAVAEMRKNMKRRRKEGEEGAEHTIWCQARTKRCRR